MEKGLPKVFSDKLYIYLSRQSISPRTLGRNFTDIVMFYARSTFFFKTNNENPFVLYNMERRQKKNDRKMQGVR